jgi:hypothetical protein
LQQVRYFKYAFAAAETFSDALAFGIGIGHEISGKRLEVRSATTGMLNSELLFRPDFCHAVVQHRVSAFLVVGRYQPLADGRALHAARTKASSAVGFRRHSKVASASLLLSAL